MTRALVVGGTGAVGAAVLRALRARGVAADFTFRRSVERARAHERDLGHRGHEVDLADGAALARLVRGRFEADDPPDAVIHCAGALEPAALAALDDAAWDRAWAVNAGSAFVLGREAARGMTARGRGSITFVGALDRGQSLPIPPAFAAAQGALAAFVMALAREVGPAGVRANLVALGLLDQGLSLGLAPEVRRDYLAYSALRRFGAPDEVAGPIVWLALDDTGMSGKVLAVNGGI